MNPPQLAARYGRHTLQAGRLLATVGLALGGRAGARLAHGLAVPVNRMSWGLPNDEGLDGYGHRVLAVTGGVTMPDATTEFFERVGRRDYEPTLAWAEGTIRFDIRDGQAVEHWLVTIEHGLFRVSREGPAASVVVSAERRVFERLIDGSENVYAAWLRDELRLAGGDPMLFYAFWRFPPIVPGPPGSHHPRSLVRPRG